VKAIFAISRTEAVASAIRRGLSRLKRGYVSRSWSYAFASVEFLLCELASSFYLERGNLDHLASGTQKSCVREIQHLRIADIFGDEIEDIGGRLRGDPFLHATSTTDPRRFARAASRMGRA